MLANAAAHCLFGTAHMTIEKRRSNVDDSHPGAATGVHRAARCHGIMVLYGNVQTAASIGDVGSIYT